ncbi:MAG: EcsC family protein [Bacillota bacterium]|nr:EcsC family protein [Bacillota bacterium]
MGCYEDNAARELIAWQKEMKMKPGAAGSLAKGIQDKMNGIIPDKAHEIITEAIKNMVKAVLTGSEYKASAPLRNENLETREKLVRDKIEFYKKAAAVTGAGTGAGGILLGLADFPILLSLKMKFLFDTAGLYGFNARNYKERLYMLYVFQLAFSSQEWRNQVFEIVANWNNYSKELPDNEDSFDWRTFQQQYRDYIDIAKMLQLVPGIGAFVGAYANYKLMDKLGSTAMNAYRLRVFRFY